MSEESESERPACDSNLSLSTLAGMITDKEAETLRTAIRNQNRRTNEKLDQITNLLAE